jgi:hypothetical protein
MKKIIFLFALVLITKYVNAVDYYIPTSSPTSLNTVNSDMTFNNDVTHNADLNMNGFTINKSTRVNTRKLAVGDVPASIEAIFPDGSAFIEGGLRTTSSIGGQANRFGLAVGSIDSQALPFIYFSPAPTASFSTTTAILTDTDAPFIDSFLNKKITITFSSPNVYDFPTADIVEIISSTQARLSFPGSGDELLIGIDIATYIIFDRPIFEINDGADTRFQIGDDDVANFEIIVPTANASNALLVDSVCKVDGHATVQINTDVNGCDSVFGILSNYDASGFDEATDVGIAHNIILDNIGSTGGDIHGIEISATDPDNSDAEIEAIAVRGEIDVLRQYLGTPASLGSGINCVLGVCVDSTTALSTTTTNVPIFTNDNDTIIIGATAKYDEINVILDTVASQSIIPEFYYSTGGVRGLTQFSPTNNTLGFTQNGAINFDSELLVSPNWSTATVTEITDGDLTDSSTYYFIEIVRTRNLVAPNTPIESIIEVTTLGTDFRWTEDGDVQVNTVSIVDGISEPTALPGSVILWVDSNEDIRAKWPDGTLGTILTKP